MELAVQILLLLVLLLAVTLAPWAVLRAVGAMQRQRQALSKRQDWAASVREEGARVVGALRRVEGAWAADPPDPNRVRDMVDKARYFEARLRMLLDLSNPAHIHLITIMRDGMQRAALNPSQIHWYAENIALGVQSVLLLHQAETEIEHPQ